MASPGYIVCERRKSRPRMQIEVCLRCRWRKGCRPLMQYLQPCLFPMPRKRGARRGDRN